MGLKPLFGEDGYIPTEVARRAKFTGRSAEAGYGLNGASVYIGRDKEDTVFYVLIEEVRRTGKVRRDFFFDVVPVTEFCVKKVQSVRRRGNRVNARSLTSKLMSEL